ncbi:hypothetical protein [Archangium sp.]|uniref:hypothetical protein n=1 Tax=Archangium sp. TaxID=1872627 RepID=UPI002D49093F|nr:hypothetical protein [Archangium sp.]HYO59719.1 hypothetical protein [Archangium sp.]
MTREESIQKALTRYPRWRVVDKPDGTVLVGSIVLSTPSGQDFRFRMRVFVPLDFPHSDAHPTARVMKHNLGGNLGADAHMGLDGTLCVQMPERHQVNYREVGLSGFLDQVTLHLDRARLYAFTGRYPGEAYDHNDKGRRQYQQELPQLLAEYVHRRDALIAHLPMSLRRYADPRVPLLENRAWCPCGSDTRFGDCHRRGLTQVRMRVAELGEPPRPLIPAGLRNPFTPRRRR